MVHWFLKRRVLIFSGLRVAAEIASRSDFWAGLSWSNVHSVTQVSTEQGLLNFFDCFGTSCAIHFFLTLTVQVHVTDKAIAMETPICQLPSGLLLALHQGCVCIHLLQGLPGDGTQNIFILLTTKLQCCNWALSWGKKDTLQYPRHICPTLYYQNHLLSGPKHEVRSHEFDCPALSQYFCTY